MSHQTQAFWSMLLEFWALFPLVLLAPLCLSGCAATTTAAKPFPKDLSLLATGTLRDEVIGEFGPPEVTLEDHRLHDEFLWERGASIPYKMVAVPFLIFFDIFGYGAASRSAATIESYVGVVVHYDDQMRVLDACAYQGWGFVPGRSLDLPLCDQDPCKGSQ